MEKFIDRPRHVEVQVLADRHGNVVHSVSAIAQSNGVTKNCWRPEPGLDPELRRRMGKVPLPPPAAPHEGQASGIPARPQRGVLLPEMNTRIQWSTL